MHDVLVIGAGHAGCEAAAAAARRGARVGLLTFRPEDAGQMSCNPSIGGVGKGHLVRELDVFDGLMARAADRAAVHRRMLNRSKGPAVWGPRIQADRKLYRTAMGKLLTENGVQIRDIGLGQGRLKTGTPPRLNGRTIDWAQLEEQPSDSEPWAMSALDDAVSQPQLRCAMARTNAATHEIIRANFDRSPLFAGTIEGRGPRYCPSIEDKVKRFAERDAHQIFIEPEGLDDHLVYPNGISTSL